MRLWTLGRSTRRPFGKRLTVVEQLRAKEAVLEVRAAEAERLREESEKARVQQLAAERQRCEEAAQRIVAEREAKLAKEREAETTATSPLSRRPAQRSHVVA